MGQGIPRFIKKYTGFGGESKFMRTLILIALTSLTALAGCGGTSPMVGERAAPVSPAKRWVDEVVPPTDPASPGFRARYDTVSVDTNLAGMIHQLARGTEVLVFYGSWCGDSRREVPHFLRIAEVAGIDRRQIVFISVDRSKSDRNGEAAKYNLQRVPTFVLLKGGREIGRIVEAPQTTLEGDLVRILVSAAQ
jgi:thiol-disulfide isomerase/thioredoxin